MPPTLEAYVPIDRRRALARGESLVERCTGAALFADVTGFSTLASRLADELGPRRAAEELLQRMNRVFAALLGSVHAYGGSVIGFAGDSITCWFDDQPLGHPGVELGARRAVACALEMRRDFDASSQSGGVTSLKIAVAAGPARRLLVGDPNVMLVDTLAGRTLARMAAGERLAVPGEVVVSEEVVGAAQAVVEAWKGDGRAYAKVGGQTAPPGPTPWPAAAAPIAESTLTPWLLAPVAERVRSQETFADLRAVVPIFASFGGIDYDDDDGARQKLDALVRRVQAVLGRAGGGLLELTIGDKGSYLYGVIGAPVAQPDAARLASSAALELALLGPDVAPARLAVGMSFGRVWSGVVGTVARRSYAVMGDEVNLAARLMQRASPGEVLVSAAFQAAAPEVDARPEGEVPVKGRAAPVPIFTLRARASATAPRSDLSALVGRAAELARFGDLLDAARAGTSGVLVIEAAAGMGKSRLANEMVRAATATRARCATGSGDAVERDSPFRAWRSVFHEILGPAPVARAAALAPDLAPRLPLLGAILGVEIEPTDVTRWMNDEARADVTPEVAARVLAAARDAHGGPLVVVLDDAHWIDSASWGLARRVVQDAPGVVVIALLRPERAGDPAPAPDRDKLFASSATTRIVLGPLADDDAIAVARGRLGVSSIAPRLEAFLRTRAAGHPLLVDLLTSSLRESGLVMVANGACTLAESFDEAAVEVPGTVEGVIGERLDRLHPDDLATLGRASVLASRFDEASLASLAPGTDAAAAVDRLVSRELLERRGSELAFHHALVRDVTYGRLLFAVRRDWHRLAAQHISARHAGDIGPWHVALAHHYVGAEDDSKASEHFGAAGEAALRAGAFRETTILLSRAISLAPASAPESVLAQHKRRLASAWYRLGDLPQSTERAEEAVRVFDRDVPKAGLRLVGRIVAELVTQVAHRVAPSRAVAEAPLDRRDDLRSAVSLYQNLSEVYYLGGLQGPSVYAALRQVNVAERTGPSHELAEAYGVLAIIAGAIGRRSLSQRYEGLAESVVRTLENPRARAMFLHQRALTGAAFGDFDRVVREETEAASIFERLGELGRRRDALGLLGTTQYLASRYDDAEATLLSLLQTRTGDDRFVQEIWGTAWLGAIALARGRTAEAVPYLERSVALLDKNTVGLMEISCVGMLGAAELRLGQAGGLAKIDRAYDLIARNKGRPTGHISLDGYTAVADAYLTAAAEAAPAAGKESGRRAEQACRWLEAFAGVFPIGRPAACLMRGRAALLRGDAERARRSFEAGLGAAEQLGMTTEAGRLRDALAAASAARSMGKGSRS